MDKAHKWTDKELKRLEKQINQEYTKAYTEMKKEMTAIMNKISVNPEMSLQQKMVLMNKHDRLNKLCEQMAETLKNTNATATSFVTKSMQNVYKQNYNGEADKLGFALLDNTAVKNIMTGEVNPFTKLAIAGEKDKQAIMRKLQSEITTSILKGESIPAIAKRLKSVAEGHLGNTVRIARTETTRIENSARQSVGDEGKKKGFNMWKRWVATGDNRTRDEHSSADGQEVPNDEPFVVGGEKMMYPGDISLGASAWNTINCRCTVVNFIKETPEQKEMAEKNNDDKFSQERKDKALWYKPEEYGGQGKARKEADKEYREKTGKVWQEATEKERYAAFEYTDDYGKYNNPLRGISFIDDETEKDIDSFTNIISKSISEKDQWLTRGVDPRGMDKFLGVENIRSWAEEDLRNELVNKIVTERGFMSTSPVKGSGFEDKSIMFNIYAPKGTPMLYAEPFARFGGGQQFQWNGKDGQSWFSDEFEIIVQRGAQLRITNVYKESNGIHDVIYMDMDLVGFDKTKNFKK